MNSHSSDTRPLTDIDVGLKDVNAAATRDRRIEFSTFAEGEYVESVLVDRTRAMEIHRDLGRLLSDEPPQAEVINPSPNSEWRLPVCPHCGSDDVIADAAARWGTENQSWEVTNVFDKGCGCNGCGAENITFKWIVRDNAERIEPTDDQTAGPSSDNPS